MISLSHIAVACSDSKAVLAKLQALGLELEKEKEVPSEKVKAGFVPVDISSHFRIELLEPTSEDSPIAKYLEKKPGGGIHHLCFEVTDLPRWEAKVRASGLEVIPPGIRTAARGRALFIHPKSFGGILVELEEITG